MKNVYESFKSEIQRLVNDNAPEEVKQIYKKSLMRRMEEKLQKFSKY